MITVSKNAVAVLKVAKSKVGAPREAGILLLKGGVHKDNGTISPISVGLAITDNPMPSDEKFEQDGLRIFVEDALIEALEGRTLDVREADEGPEFVIC